MEMDAGWWRKLRQEDESKDERNGRNGKKRRAQWGLRQEEGCFLEEMQVPAG
jgi:hypothetical protein